VLIGLLLSPAVGPPASAGAAASSTSAASGSTGSGSSIAGEGPSSGGTSSPGGGSSGSSGGSGGGASGGGAPGAGPSGQSGSSAANGESSTSGESSEESPEGGSSFVALLGGKAPSALGSPDAKVATEIGPLRQKLAHQMSLGGPGASAYVYDLTAEEPLYAVRPQRTKAPASVEKLYTSTAALMTMGPTARLATSVMSTGHLGAEGVFDGNLYLAGGGDPTFGTRLFLADHYENKGTSVSSLVEKLKAYGIRRVVGDVEGDESFWDYLRGDPSSGFAPDIYLEGTLSALEFNRGETGGLTGQHAPAAYAALELKRGLEAAGIKVQGDSGAATTPEGAKTLAVAPSPQLSVLLHLMLPPSDNFFAESLVKDLGAIYGSEGTTKAGVQVVREQIGKLGLDPQIVDGSGLDRADHTSPEQVVDLLRMLAGTRDGGILREDLAVAGKSGTLEERMLDSFATGRCQGKTGTLTGVSNLAGYCEAANGDLIAFAIFNDDIATYSAHVIQDAMAETIADY
jgi:serine-type D-Ala-D-Ala carboxypeptidase/endopeptidase (penicillin-binding protein 4)